MKYHNSTTEYNCGIDLHARQMYVCVMDRQGKKLVHTNVKDNDFKFFLKLVADQKSRLPRVCAAADGARYRPDLGPDHSPRNRRHSPLPQRQRLPLLLSPGQRHGASAGKIKGLRGAKLGNPCLRWAFGEAAVIAKRDHAIIGPPRPPSARRSDFFLERTREVGHNLSTLCLPGRNFANSSCEPIPRERHRPDHLAQGGRPDGRNARLRIGARQAKQVSDCAAQGEARDAENV